MPEYKENKRHSKVAAGIVATSNRLETTKAVLNCLKNVQNLEHLLFLKGSAALALAILATIQDIEDGDIDDNFLALALDSCGLLYIVINRCEEESKRNGDVFDQMKVYSGELVKNLQEISRFVDKKINRKFFKRIVKHSADGQKVMNYRDQLRKWMMKFGNSTNFSIHDVLQEVIDEKLHRQEQRETSSKDEILPQNLHDVAPAKEKFSTTYVQPPKIEPILPKVLDEPRHLMNPSMQVDDTTQTPSRTATPDSPALRQSIHRLTLEDEEKGEREKQRAEAEASKAKRLERERTTKQAEQERWRESALIFSQLPQARGDDEERRFLAVSCNTAPSSVTKPMSLVEVESNPELGNSWEQASNYVQSASELEDNWIAAAALHEEIQRAEDEEVAIEVSRRERLKCEAEEKRNDGEGLRPKKKRAKRSPRNSRVSAGPSPEESARSAIDLESFEHENNSGPHNSPHRYYSQTPEPDLTADPSHRSHFVSQGSDPSYRSYPLPPNPYNAHPFTSAYHQSPLSNIPGSGNPLASAPYTASNYNSGNVTTTIMTNCGNDYSVRYGRKSD